MAILTVSRKYGSGSRDVLRIVIDTLGYELLDKQALMADIETSGLKWASWARELDETSPFFWERYDRSFKGFGALAQSIILDRALRDNVILKGRGGNFVLEGIPHVFRVRFVAPMEDRIKRIIERDSLDAENARLVIEKSDEGKKGFIYALYGKKVNNANHYDAVFNTGRQSVEEMADVILRTLASREALKTPEGCKTLELRAVTAKIKAKLIMDPKLYVPVLEVESGADEVVLRGIVRNSDQYERITAAAKELAGEWPVKVELRYRV